MSSPSANAAHIRCRSRAADARPAATLQPTRNRTPRAPGRRRRMRALAALERRARPGRRRPARRANPRTTASVRHGQRDDLPGQPHTVPGDDAERGDPGERHPPDPGRDVTTRPRRVQPRESPARTDDAREGEPRPHGERGDHARDADNGQRRGDSSGLGQQPGDEHSDHGERGGSIARPSWTGRPTVQQQPTTRPDRDHEDGHPVIGGYPTTRRRPAGRQRRR